MPLPLTQDVCWMIKVEEATGNCTARGWAPVYGCRPRCCSHGSHGPNRFCSHMAPQYSTVLMWLYHSDWRLKCKEDVITWHHNCIYSQRRFRLHGVPHMYLTTPESTENLGNGGTPRAIFCRWVNAFPCALLHFNHWVCRAIYFIGSFGPLFYPFFVVMEYNR